MNNEVLFHISKNVIMFENDNNLLIDNYVDHKRSLLKVYYAPILFYFFYNKSLKEANKEFYYQYERDLYNDVILKLIENKIIIPAGTQGYHKQMLGFTSLPKEVKYYHFAKKVFNNNKYQKVSDEFWKLVSQSDNMPAIYKTYKNDQTISLPHPSDEVGENQNITQYILDRESIRITDNHIAVSLQSLSDLLYYSVGVTGGAIDFGMGRALYKTTATPGARASIENYLLIFNVEAVQPGVYHYSSKDHILEIIKTGNFKDTAIKMVGNQFQVKSSNFLIISTSRIDRITWKYKDNNIYTAPYIEYGSSVQNVYLLAPQLNLGVTVIGAVVDEIIDELLDLDINVEFPLGIMSIGNLDSKDSKQEKRFYKQSMDNYLEGEKNLERENKIK